MSLSLSQVNIFFQLIFICKVQMTGYKPSIAPDSVRYSLLYYKAPDEDLETRKLRVWKPIFHLLIY